MKNVLLISLLTALVLIPQSAVLATVTPKAKLSLPLKIDGDVGLVIAQNPDSVLKHFMTANLVVTRGGQGVNGLDIKIGGVKLIQHTYGLPGNYYPQSNTYKAVSGTNLLLEVRPGKMVVHSPAIGMSNDVLVSATAQIGTVIAITAPSEDVVTISNSPSGRTVPGLIRRTLNFAWTGGSPAFTFSLLKYSGSVPLSFYEKSVPGRTHAVSLSQFSSGMTYSVHVACSFNGFRFKAARGAALDPSSSLSLRCSAMDKFQVKIVK